jgi:uncharacterized DUF497 family protein
MNEDAFEWDDDTAAANWLAHGVAFPQAVKAFRDPFGVEWIDERENYGEERINLLGMCGGVILHVTYTERGEHTRLISARRAEKHEQDHYYRENSV